MAKKPAAKPKRVYIGMHVEPVIKKRLAHRAAQDRRSLAALGEMILAQWLDNQP